MRHRIHPNVDNFKGFWLLPHMIMYKYYNVYLSIIRHIHAYKYAYKMLVYKYAYKMLVSKLIRNKALNDELIEHFPKILSSTLVQY